MASMECHSVVFTQAAKEHKEEIISKGLLQSTTAGGKLPPSQLNSLLRRYPQPKFPPPEEKKGRSKTRKGECNNNNNNFDLCSAIKSMMQLFSYALQRNENKINVCSCKKIRINICRGCDDLRPTGRVIFLFKL